MKIYNTLTRTKEDFIPLEKGAVKIYACGPTVYNFIHIGNARPLCVFDILRRYFEYAGYKVTFVQNFTDIDDKLIRKAAEENTTVAEVADRFTAEYWTDAKGLGVKEATHHPKATDNIEEIIDIVQSLCDKGFAYQIDDGVYFRAGKFEEYGKLSHMPLDDLFANASERVGTGDGKENPMDFCLWKLAKPGEPFWESPWGQGRPGWHIECSAMARRYLGQTIDIHCGGEDLVFPHHENEIAQSECANGAPFARYWMHNGFINIDNKKMSKSAGNFFTVRDVAEKYGYEPIRYLMIASHYRSPINYSLDIIEQCRSALERLYNCRENLIFALSHAVEGQLIREQAVTLDGFKASFKDAMEDDFNTANALSVLFDLTKYINQQVLNSGNKALCEAALAVFNELAGVLGLLYSREEASADEEVEQLIEQRTAARKNKDFAEADRIRDQLKAMNIILEDTPQGVKWSKG